MISDVPHTLSTTPTLLTGLLLAAALVAEHTEEGE